MRQGTTGKMSLVWSSKAGCSIPAEVDKYVQKNVIGAVKIPGKKLATHSVMF